MKMSCQRKSNQDRNDQPAVVQADFDPKDAPDFDL
jgi:hypothetical protein